MKKFFLTSLVAIIATGVGYKVIAHAQNLKPYSALTMTNIEALSNSEFIVDWDKNCKPGGDGCCPGPMYWLPNDLPY